jgi:hypothetical protein
VSVLRSYDVTELVSFDVQPNGSVLPNPLPTCAVCGAIITGYHDCVPPISRTPVTPLGGIYLTPWGTWEWRHW